MIFGAKNGITATPIDGNFHTIFFFYGFLCMSFKQTDREIDRQTDRQTDGRTDGRMDGWMDGWMEGKDNTAMYKDDCIITEPPASLRHSIFNDALQTRLPVMPSNTGTIGGMPLLT